MNRHEPAGDYLRETAPVFYLAVDSREIVVDTNPHTQRIIGTDPRSRSYRSVFVDFSGALDLASLAAAPETEHLLNVVTFTGLPETYYFRFFREEGLILAFGRRDLGELERLRRELVSHSNELSNLTREVHRKNAELTRLNNLKNLFLGMAAHDLRTHIGIVLNYSDYLLEEAAGNLGEEHRRFLDNIHESGNAMERMVDDFLDIAVIESGRLVLDTEPVDLNALISRSVAARRGERETGKANLRFTPREKMPVIMLDAPKISQVMDNLLSNALAHSPEAASVTIRSLPANDAVHVSVTDKGPGSSSIPGRSSRCF